MALESDAAGDPDCLAASSHEAAAPSAGASKTILQRWFYWEPFPGLGRRPVDPPLPPRAPKQPRVSCDGIGGYCRLYDEWNFDHLVDYRKQFGFA